VTCFAAGVHQVRLSSESGIHVVVARGELDAFAAPDLAGCFEQCAPGSGLVIDLTDVSFLDSTALGVVARAVRQLRENGGGARVVLPRGAARRIFEITTLDRALPVSESPSTALDELAARG
jgi:anti-sigma B factor antagonist